MRPFLIALATASLLAGCAVKEEQGYIVKKSLVIDVRSDAEMLEASKETAHVDDFGALTREPIYHNSKAMYSGQALNKHIGDYVQNMAQDLVSNMEYVSEETPIGVTHFALTDSDLNTTNLLGYQIAESFIHELHKFRIPVLDYKATNYIRVTETGDFILSRDFLELKHKVPMDYVLTGTMTKHQGGYLVNARVLGLETKAVVASAQMLVPFYIADALLPTNENRIDGVKLMQGE